MITGIISSNVKLYEFNLLHSNTMMMMMHPQMKKVLNNISLFTCLNSFKLLFGSIVWNIFKLIPHYLK